MSRLASLWLVALREIRERFRSKAYLITTGLTVLVAVGLIAGPSLFGSDTEELTIGTVGEGNEAILATAVELADAERDDDEPPSVAIDAVAFDGRDAALSALDEGRVDAVIIDGSQLVVETTTGFGGSSIANRLQEAAAAVRIQTLVEEEGEQAADIIALLTSDPLEVTTPDERDPAESEGRTIIAYAGLLLLYMAVLLYGTWILTGVTEEKSNRVVEVLLSSIRPWQVLGGKILGIGLLAIAQLLVTIVAAVLALRVTGGFDLPPIELTAAANLLVWFVLGFLTFAVLFGAAGSLVSRTEEANTIAMPMTLTAVAGFFVSINALNDPSGPVSLVSTFVPLTAPFVVPVRAALQAIPLWQYLLAVLISLLSLAVFTVVAGRIYAGGVLRFGSRLGWRDAWRSSRE